MKQKVKVTREQIDAAMRAKATKGNYKLSALGVIYRGEDGDWHIFPDSIEVEVDVPDVVDAQEKLADSMIKSIQPYKLMAPAIYHVGTSYLPCVSSMLFDSYEDAKLSGGGAFFHWPATIDPVTGMYKVPTKESK